MHVARFFFTYFVLYSSSFPFFFKVFYNKCIVSIFPGSFEEKWMMFSDLICIFPLNFRNDDWEPSKENWTSMPKNEKVRLCFFLVRKGHVRSRENTVFAILKGPQKVKKKKKINLPHTCRSLRSSKVSHKDSYHKDPTWAGESVLTVLFRIFRARLPNRPGFPQS